jgi:GT2 family glycosyltransferase
MTRAMQARPSISAIVCAFNEERLLPAALHSLLAQTRMPDEIIVVNNASTDGTRQVARPAAWRRAATSSSTWTPTAARRYG